VFFFEKAKEAALRYHTFCFEGRGLNWPQPHSAKRATAGSQIKATAFCI
jgi:hypothetical protein